MSAQKWPRSTTRTLHHVRGVLFGLPGDRASIKKYIGPHALLKAFLRVMDRVDSSPGERLKDLDQAMAFSGATPFFNCIDACPKGLNPTQASRRCGSSFNSAKPSKRLGPNATIAE